uniref:IFM1 protein n=1 Tax=Ornithorhynchus anatinus TaxID=9258 RepID=A0A6I8MY41_ORNAN
EPHVGQPDSPVRLPVMDDPNYSKPGFGAPPGPSPSTVISIPSPPPRDYLVWSLFSTLYMNFCCLGLIAFIFSVKARDRKVMGDMIRAQEYSHTAKRLNSIALALSLVFFFICIITVLVITFTVR